MGTKMAMNHTSIESKAEYEQERQQKRKMQQMQRQQLVRRQKKQLLCILGIVLIICLIIRCTAKAPKPKASTATPTTSNAVDIDTTSTVETDSTSTLETDTTSMVETDSTSDILDSFSIHDWNLVLINEHNLLTSDIELDSAYLDNGMQVDARIYDELMQMLDDGSQAGLSFIVCSAYRTISYQEGLFNNQVAALQREGMNSEEAYLAAKTSVAVPGASEHHFGLAVDIISASYQFLDEQQATTPEYQWLKENSYKYGFIVRYPEGSSNVTGFIYEPWHFRYVGVDAATYMAEHDLILEEFLDLI